MNLQYSINDKFQSKMLIPSQTESAPGIYSETCSKDHPYIKTTCLYRPYITGPQGYTFHVNEPAYKDHLHVCIRTTFCWSLRWSLYTSFTVSAEDLLLQAYNIIFILVELV